VGHLLEAGNGRSADALGGRVGGDEFGILGLDVLQPLEQPVVLGVGNYGVIERMVKMVVVGDLLAERLQLLANRPPGCGS